jgi:hypothetical protein
VDLIDTIVKFTLQEQPASVSILAFYFRLTELLHLLQSFMPPLYQVSFSFNIISLPISTLFTTNRKLHDYCCTFAEHWYSRTSQATFSSSRVCSIASKA